MSIHGGEDRGDGSADSGALVGGVVATVGGALLFLALFLPFYSLEAFGVTSSANGWQTLTYLDLFLAVAAAVIVPGGVLMILSSVPSVSKDLPVKLPLIVCCTVIGIAALAGVFVLFRIVEIPPALNHLGGVDIGRGAGIILAFIASISASGAALFVLLIGGLIAKGGTTVPSERPDIPPLPTQQERLPPNPTDRMS